MADRKEIIARTNIIRANSGSTYKSLVPVFNDKNFDLKIIESAVIDNPIARNEYINGLFNMIGKTTTTGLEYDIINPFAKKYTDGFENGAYERELAVDLVDEVEYQFTESAIAEMFKLHLPTVAQAFHKITRQVRFPITIAYNELRLAFENETSYGDFVTKFDKILIESNKAKEYEYSRDLLISTANRGYMPLIELDNDVTDSDSADAFIKAVKKLVAHFPFVGTQGTQISNMDTDLAIKTWCPKDKAEIYIDTDVQVELDVEMLAKAFNKSYVELQNSTYEFDTLGFTRINTAAEGEEPVYKYYKNLAIVADERFVRIRNVLKEMWDTKLTTVMAYNKDYHVWQSYSTSPFVRGFAVVVEVEETDIPEGYFDNLTETTTDTDAVSELTNEP